MLLFIRDFEVLLDFGAEDEKRRAERLDKLPLGRLGNLDEGSDRPFFLAVGFWKPHAPFNAPKKYWDLYDPRKLPPLDPTRPVGAPEWAFHNSGEILGAPPKAIKPTAEQVAEMRHGYLANISYMDAQVGKVLKALDDLKLAERTVIVFLADHGYHLGEHTLWGKTSCFELDAHVPLIVAAPGAKNRRATPALAELVVNSPFNALEFLGG